MPPTKHVLWQTDEPMGMLRSSEDLQPGPLWLNLLDHGIGIMVSNGSPESLEHCRRDLRSHFEGDGPEKKPVDHANSDQPPGLVPGRYLTTFSAEMLQVMDQKVSFGPTTVFDPDGTCDVVAHVEIPRSALDQLPIHQARASSGVEVQIADVGVAMEQTARLGGGQQL